MTRRTDTDIERINKMVETIRESYSTSADEKRQGAEELAAETYQQTIDNITSKLQIEKEAEMKEISKRHRIREAQIKNNVNLEVLKSQTESLHEVLTEAIQRLNAFSEGPEYPDLLKKLIAEGLDRLKESKVRLMIRKKDKEIAQNVLGEAVQIAEKLNPGLTIKAQIDEQRFLPAPPHCAGGVILICQKGKIKVSNVLNDRLKLAYEGMLPQIREIICGPNLHPGLSMPETKPEPNDSAEEDQADN